MNYWFYKAFRLIIIVCEGWRVIIISYMVYMYLKINFSQFIWGYHVKLVPEDVLTFHLQGLVGYKARQSIFWKCAVEENDVLASSGLGLQNSSFGEWYRI